MNFVESGFVHNGYFIRDTDTQGNFRFDGLGKKIHVNAGVTSITMDDMFSRWEDWVLQEDNLKWASALRYSGKDPIPGGETGTTFFSRNGWKLVYDPNLTAVSGVLYSEDYATAFWNADGHPIYPATVSAMVLSSGAGSGSSGPSAAEIAAAILAAAQITPIYATTQNSSDIKEDILTDARTLTVSKFIALGD